MNNNEPDIIYCIPIDGGILATAGPSKKEALTQTEQALKKILQTVSIKTIFGKCLSISLCDDPAHFRKLIEQLKEDLRDTPETLTGLIGSEGVKLLKACT